MKSFPFHSISNHACARAALSAMVIMCLNSCVTYSIDMVELARANAEKSRGPAPESEWNALGIWQRVPGEGPSYIPRDYPKSAARGEKEGAWVVDQRDGKRLFVPHAGVPNCPHAVLQAEAKKVTNWKPRQIVTKIPGIMVM